MIQRKITEAELRLFGFCPKLFEFNAMIEYKNEMQLACKEMIERFLIYQLRNGNNASYDLVIPTIIKESVRRAYSNHEEIEANGLRDLATKRLNSWFNDYINKFRINEYQVVIGPYNPKIVISQTAIELDVCGILFNTKTNTIHILTWFNEVKSIDPLWDLPSVAKYYFSQSYTDKEVVIHFLDINHRNTYSKEFSMYIKSIPGKEFEEESKLFLIEKVKEFENYSNYYRIPYCIFYECPKRKECQK
jgi:hypothetical protein